MTVYLNRKDARGAIQSTVDPSRVVEMEATKVVSDEYDATGDRPTRRDMVHDVELSRQQPDMFQVHENRSCARSR